MEYKTSAVEIKRRKTAYFALAISIVIGTFLSSKMYSVSLPTFLYGSELIALTLLGALSFFFFKKISRMNITLSANALWRTAGTHQEKYLFSQIEKIYIKWTTRHTLREVYIWMTDGRSVFLTGLQNFKQLRQELLSKVDRKAEVHEWREPLDFDSQLFYPLLGLLISNMSVLSFKKIIQLNPRQLRLGLVAFAGYLFIFSGYFFLVAPISKRSGNHTKIQDVITGIVMLIAAAFVLLCVLEL